MKSLSVLVFFLLPFLGALGDDLEAPYAMTQHRHPPANESSRANDTMNPLDSLQQMCAADAECNVQRRQKCCGGVIRSCAKGPGRYIACGAGEVSVGVFHNPATDTALLTC
jgi:hypothetical protein